MARDSEQPSLFGFEAAPRDKHLILMIYPDQQARTAAQARGRRYQADNGLGGAIFNPDLMHVTLGHFDYWDEVPASLIERISRAASKLSMSPFQVSFDQIGGFPGNVVLRGGEGLKALEAFQAALRHALAWEARRLSHELHAPPDGHLWPAGRGCRRHRTGELDRERVRPRGQPSRQGAA